MRKPLFLGLGLVGAAILFLAISKRLRGSMLPPCPTCGRRDPLVKVASTGFPMGDAILWLCSCGDTRGVLINDDVPRSSFEKALARYEMKERTKRERTTDMPNLG